MGLNRIRATALFLSAALLSAAPVHASADQALVTGNEVNVRTGPGSAYAAFSSIDSGTTVEVVNRTNADWYLVSWDGNSGYVSSQFLELMEEDSTASISVEVAETAGYIDGMYVCLRSAPDTASTILGTYSSGKALTITGISGDWTAVRIDDKDGFVYSDFVREGMPGSAVVEVDVTDPYGGTPITVSVSPAVDQPAVQNSSTMFFALETASPAPAQAPLSSQTTVFPADNPEDPASFPSQFSGLQVSVPTESAFVSRAAPISDPSFHILAPSEDVSSAATEVNVADLDNDPGTADSVSVSWAADASSPTLPSSAAPSPAPFSPPVNLPEAASSAVRPLGRVTGNVVRLRSGPGTTYSILGTCSLGTEVSVVGVSGEWTSVIVPDTGMSGYIYSDFIERSEPGSGVSAVPDTSAASGSFTPASFRITDGYITGNSVRLRAAPSMTAEILNELNYGTSVKMTGISGEWFRIIAGGQEGYVSSSFVTEGSYRPEEKLSSVSGTEIGKEIAAYALQYVGTPYKWGGNTPESGFDCSGFVQYIYGQFGYTTSRVANDALSDGVHVDPADLQPGDLLCFYSGSNYVGHLGIYIGDSSFVHAANSASGVVTTSLSTGYYASRGYEIRRIA